MGGNNSSDEGSMYLSLEIDIPDTRTRAIDMTPGAPLYLENIWVGIYRKENGHRVGGTPDNQPIDLQHRLTASGVQLKDIVQIEGSGADVMKVGDSDLVVVGVANSKKTETIKGNLADELKDADTWDKFIDIIVDTQQEFTANTPVLMGFLQPISYDNTEKGYNYIKVDQFATGSDAINLSGSSDSGGSNADNVLIKVASVDENGKIKSLVTTNYILKLRRLRSKINFNIETKDNIIISNLSYKVFNVPNSVFLAQRRTNTFDGDCSGKANNNFSPNSADVKNHGYHNMDWETPPDNHSFSFEQFENKHWAKNKTDLSEYHDREAHSGDVLYGELDHENTSKPVFSILADKTEDWNNNASYVVLRMSIRDENTGRNADVDYIIHEGFINSDDGIVSTNMKTRLNDFSCFRNTDYYYYIRIMGVDEIETRVSSNSEDHINDQYGKIWDIEYVKSEGNFVNYIVVDKENPLYVAKSIKFDKNADIGFRLLGNEYEKDGSSHPVDICYNFSRGQLYGFEGIWKDPSVGTTQYLVSIGAEGQKSNLEVLNDYFTNNTDSYINSTLEGIKIKIKNVEEYKTIVEYINYIHEPENQSEIEGFVFDKISNYPKDCKAADYLRGLYIFDRKEAISGKYMDDDECCVIYKIYGALQYPFEEQQKLDKPLFSMPATGFDSFIVGLDDHTIEIEPVNGADTYIFTVTGEGGYSYTETRLVNNETSYSIVSNKGNFKDSDSNGGSRFRKVKKNGRDVYLYSVFYGASKGGLMNMTSGNKYKFTVKAVDSTNKKSDSSESQIIKTVYLPIWKFSDYPWISITPTKEDLGPNWSMTYRGLTIARGSNTLAFYNSLPNSYKYAFNTKGAGSYESHTSCSRAFMMHTVVQGSIRAIASNTSDKEDLERKIYAWANGNTKVAAAGYSYVDPKEAKIEDMTPDFTVDENLENYVMYSSANLHIYQVSFMPTGTARPFHKGVDDVQ